MIDYIASYAIYTGKYFFCFLFFFNDTATTEIYTLSLHDALPIYKISEIKRISEKPVAIGFGISNPEQAAMAAELADGVIVGSAIVKIIENNIDKSDLTTIVGSFVKGLKRGMQGK